MQEPPRSAEELAERLAGGAPLLPTVREQLARVRADLDARFVAGETLEEALAACERLRAAGYLTTVDVLGESVSSSVQAEAAAGALPQ